MGAPERIGSKIMSKGYVKTYSVERIKVEIPVDKFNTPMPKSFVKDIEDLALRNRDQIMKSVKNFLPKTLENFLSKIVVQEQQLSKVYKQVKFITLRRFAGNDVDGQIESLFTTLTQLPLRYGAENTSSNELTLSELFVY